MRDSTPKTETEIINLALERFKLAADADEAWRQDCLDDLTFSTGDQWPLTIQTIREKDGRPCLIMDQIQQSIRLVCNQYRQQPPSITVNPVGNGADVDTAEILQGMIRHIEVNCDAQVSYEEVHEGIVRCGFGNLRVRNDYSNDDSEDQEIILESTRNQFSVYWQPGVPQEKAAWAFIVYDVPISTYNLEYPDSKMATSSDFTATGNSPPQWVGTEEYRVAEYYEVLETEREGKAPKREVIWRKINAFEILDGKVEGKKVPGKRIPIFTGYGDDLDVNGKRYVAGLVRNAKGPQRQYNYMVSGATELVALAPKAPWIVAEGQLSGREVQWEQSNIRNFAVLTYKQTDVGGKPAPPPQRMATEPPIQAMAQMIGQASLDLKASLGIYDPSLGQRKGDESGKAIEKLQAQGSVATLNFADNMSRMMRQLGKSLLVWIREIYTEPRVQRIINPDGSVKHVVIHNGEDQAEDARMLAEESDIKNIYDVGVGEYDVVISVGPTYQSKRQEAVATQLDLLKVVPPQIAQNLLDLVVRNFDIPQANEMADRLKKMLPPQLVDGDESDPKVQVQQLQAQLQQLGKQHELMAKALTDTTDALKTKQVEQQGKVQIAQLQEMSKQEIVRLQEATKLAVAQMNASKDVNQSFADTEAENYQLLHKSAHELAMQKDQQQHDQGMAAKQQTADAQSQQADQEQAQQSQASDQAHQSQMATMSQGEDQNG